MSMSMSSNQRKSDFRDSHTVLWWKQQKCEAYDNYDDDEDDEKKEKKKKKNR